MLLSQPPQHLRQNSNIDYTQLGLAYQLHLCEVLYNRAICKSRLNDLNGTKQDLQQAQTCKVSRDHDRIDEAIRAQVTFFLLPSLFRFPL